MPAIVASPLIPTVTPIGIDRQNCNIIDHTQYDQKRDPDKVVRVDGEEDTLYSDGLEVEDDTTPMGTAGNTRIP